jgi:hypothetical protein
MNFTANIWCSCLHVLAWLQEVIHLSFCHMFLKISAWHLRVRHCGRSYTLTKNWRPQPSSSCLRNIRRQPSNELNELTLGLSDQLGTMWWTCQCVPGLPQLPPTSCCTRSWGCQRCTLLHHVRCPLPTVCVEAPPLLNPIHKTHPTTKYGHQVNSSVKQRK